MRILLACAAGMSTSFLVSKMKKVAEAQGKNYDIWATDVDSIYDEDKEFDLILIGPQVADRKAEVKEIANEFGVPFDIIDKENYGKVNGEAVLKQAEEIYNSFYKKG